MTQNTRKTKRQNNYPFLVTLYRIGFYNGHAVFQADKSGRTIFDSPKRMAGYYFLNYGDKDSETIEFIYLWGKPKLDQKVQ